MTERALTAHIVCEKALSRAAHRRMLRMAESVCMKENFGHVTIQIESPACGGGGDDDDREEECGFRVGEKRGALCIEHRPLHMTMSKCHQPTRGNFEEDEEEEDEEEKIRARRRNDSGRKTGGEMMNSLSSIIKNNDKQRRSYAPLEEEQVEGGGGGGGEYVNAVEAHRRDNLGGVEMQNIS